MGRPRPDDLGLGAAQSQRLYRTPAPLQKLEARKDPTEQLKQIEECVAAAVAERLEDGEVLLCHYSFCGAGGGDLDALVAGRWEGKDVET
jgi:hypothetical protein